MTADRIASIKADVEEAERQWKAGSKQYRTSAKGIRGACVVADIQFLLAALAEKDARIKELEAKARKQLADLLITGTERDLAEARINALQADIGLLHRKMTSPRITEMEAQIEALQAENDRLKHDLDTITVKDSELFQRLELRGRIKELEANVTYWKSQFEGRGVE
jgi:SMC interacting uncharacterized protein involved in chromosome segregation